MLVQISIPIPDLYYGKEIYHQNIYFDCGVSPTKEQVISYLVELDNRDKAYPEYLGNWQECICSVELVTEWKEVGYRQGIQGKLMQTSSFVHRKDLRQINPSVSMTWFVIEVKTL
jgi:hypothetical protein